MADSESFGVATNVGKSSPNADAKENPNETPLGIFSPFPYSPEPFVDLSKDGREALLTFGDIATLENHLSLNELKNLMVNV